MGMTMTQKILAAHAGLDSVTAGQLIEAKLDVVMANDITGPMALPIFREMAEKVYDKDKVVLVPDHFTPNKDIKSAENSKAIREFAREQGLSWYFEQGKSGVEHAILPEAGVVVGGECIIGADKKRELLSSNYPDASQIPSRFPAQPHLPVLLFRLPLHLSCHVA